MIDISIVLKNMKPDRTIVFDLLHVQKGGNMAEGEAVKVAVRVRPFNGRELNMDAKLCIRMEGK